MAVTRTAQPKRPPGAPSRRLDSPRHLFAASGVVMLLLACVGLLSTGCRSRAYQDVYQQELLSEIRVLEDQLYEADYENRKLAEKLKRVQRRIARGAPADDAADADFDSSEPSGESAGPSRESAERSRREPGDGGPSGRPAQPDAEPGAGGAEFELDDDLMIDPGEAFDPGEPADPEADRGELLPAPGGPQPPGEQDLRIPPIEEGEPVPPPSPGEEPDNGPPGKIEIDAVNVLGDSDAAGAVPTPKTLRLQPGFSGGHDLDSDDQADGLLLVVSVIDDAGTEVDLSQFELTADLTVVALDPLREPSDARLARWEFSAEKLQQWIGSRPVHGLHIPVAWQGKQPLGDEVAVHLRLEGADESQLSCEATLPLKQPASVAQWNPRGEADASDERRE